MRLRRGLAATALLLAVSLGLPAVMAAQDRADEPKLADLDIEQLARIPVASAARRLEPLAHATAAIFVITREDIRRAGSGSVPEALRLAPGLQVARVTARDWSITARGFAEQSPNKLLVLIDGRAVYSPLFAGVFWDVQVVPIEDVERIEVILGPGATLWGSNAVNGVINVITRAASVTRGGLVAVRTGTSQPIGATARYGFGLGSSTALRIYGMFSDRDPSRLADGTEGEDDWRHGQGGFRLDANAGGRTRMTLQGDVYGAEGDQQTRLVSLEPPFAAVVPGERKVNGGNLLARAIRTWSEHSEILLRTYYDRAVRDQPPGTGRVAVDIVDVEVVHRIRPAARHAIVWGGGYRAISDRLEPTFAVELLPSSRSTHLLTGFVQDEIALARDRFYLTLGTKLERNEFSGIELQPNLRLRWLPAVRHTLWSAVSRAVRIPTRLDTDIRFNAQVVPGSPITIVRVEGNEDFDSEELISAESGYRGEVSRSLSVDASVFYSWYDRLRSVHPLAPTVEQDVAVQPITLGNASRGTAYGGTLAANWQPAKGVLVRASYSRLEMDVTLRDDAPAGSSSSVNPGFNPSHQGSLSAYVALPQNLELHVGARYVGALSEPRIEDYAEVGVRFGWKVRPNLTLGLRGQDLLRSQHREFSSLPQRDMPRRAELQAEWRF